jgi:hypothetical protein
VGEKEIRPFHSGFARSISEAGTWASLIWSLLYTSTVERPAKPVHAPSSGRYCAGILSRVAWSSFAKRFLLSTSAIAGEFSVRNTSAGEASPSATSWLPSSRSEPLRSFTSVPVFLVKAFATASISSSCWAL